MAKVFISYSHKDTAWMERLNTQLKVLEMEDICSIWVDTEIETGSDWKSAIETALNDAHIIVMLISADFLTSRFIRDVEVSTALERREKEGVRVIPLLLKPCPWKKVDWLSRMQIAPRDAKPLSGMSEHEADTVLAKLAEMIAGAVSYQQPPKEKETFSPLPTEHVLISLPVTGADLFGREKELAVLEQAWEARHTHIVTLIAWGGVGKTALVNRRIMDMEHQNFRGARRVYGWSFYSQGAEEGKQASADSFLQQTLKWFGDPDPTVGDAVEKGKRLAALVRRQKTLLILDGLEPLQYPKANDEGMAGQLKDKGLRAFLRQLSLGMDGLCMVTSREMVKDLADRTAHTVREMRLEHLEPGAGAELLEHLGVKGSEKDMLDTASEYGGHALALTLLGRYVSTVFDGDVRQKDRMPALTVEPEKGGHARRVMAAHEQRLGDSAERNILYMMGLFDRPVAPGALEALKAEPMIDGVTDRLRKISEADWKYALDRLRTTGLSAAEDPAEPGALDAHPLVREHFGERLRIENPKGWMEANKRLYHYYKDLPDKELPDTLQEMEPLFAAVAHGCRAGLQQEAVENVYWKRIRRGEEAYTVKKLGAFGADLAALSHFFETPWSTPSANLKPEYQADVLNWAGFRLRAMGRLREAVQPLKASLKTSEKLTDWKECARTSSNLSELLLTLGEVAEAVRLGRDSLRWADQSGNWGEISMRRTTVADALLQAGGMKEAETWFRKAETLQQEHQPKYHYLYSLRGYQFCDLLLDRGETDEVIRRAEQTLEWVTPPGLLLAIALDTLTLGRARLTPPDIDAAAALPYLDRAVMGLREAGQQEFLMRGLIFRAAGRRLLGEFDTARQDLEEALEIITLGEMKLHRVDYLLEKGRLAEAEKEKENARKYYDEAGILIEETGYKRRAVPKE